jgi:hypothetical protein
METYYKILKEQLKQCQEHKRKYNLIGTDYNAYEDAKGCTYYYILYKHSENKELTVYAKEQLLEDEEENLFSRA